MGPPLGDYSEAFSGIDNIPGTPTSSPEPREARESKPEPKPKEEPSRTPPEKEAKQKDDAPKKRSVGDDLEGILKPKEDTKPAQDKVPKTDDPDRLFDAPETPRQLRDSYKKTKDELAKTSSRVKELEAAVEKARIDGTETIHKDYETRLAESERRRAEMETELRFLDYQKSEDYNSKYQTPLRQAWTETLSALEGLSIETEDGTSREVQPQDIAKLMQMPNVQARKAAESMFGTAAPEVMQYRAKLMGLTTARSKALEEWKVKGSEREAQIAESRRATIKQWETSIDEIRQERPELFGDRPEDSDGNNLLKNGFGLARKAFLGEGIPEGLTPDQRREAYVEAQTQVALRAAAYPRTLRDLKLAERQIESLKAKLAEYEDSELPPGDRRSEGHVATGKDRAPEDEIDAIPGTRY